MTFHHRPINLLVTVTSDRSAVDVEGDLRTHLQQEFTDPVWDTGVTVTPLPLHLDAYRGHVELRDVDAFHTKFCLEVPSTPHFLDEEALEFRLKFLREEVQEFEDAHRAGDMKGAADALVDLVYVAVGTALMMGLRAVWWSLWGRVQDKNMLKRRAGHAGESKRGSSLDVVKPEGWTPPDHTPDLGNAPWPVWNYGSKPAPTSIDCRVGDSAGDGA